jgi:hypothetical protein
MTVLLREKLTWAINLIIKQRKRGKNFGRGTFLKDANSAVAIVEAGLSVEKLLRNRL